MERVLMLRRGGPVRRIVKKILRTIRSPHKVIQEIGQRRNSHRRRAQTLETALTPERIGAIRFSAVDQPVASIVIPVFNYIAVTVVCLESIALHGAEIPFEVIVVDDASTDKQVAQLARIEGLRILRNDQNLGFVRTSNRGATAARGNYIVFLNNDTEVTEGWLEALLGTFRDFPDAGLVGGKLLFPDGTLQEAGGIVWHDGSAWNYGRGRQPEEPGVSYARRVDYCSGACLAISRDLFHELEGFDEIYVAAYYEDTDLAFRVREVGRKVYYQPTCIVYHDEGTTSGTSTEHGIKKFQVENGRKFYERWKEVLLEHHANGKMPELEKDRDVSTRTLFIDHRMVTPDQDSGSVRTFNLLRILQGLGHKVTFVPDNLAKQSPYTEQLQAVGIEVLHHPFISSIEAHLKSNGEYYDYVFLSRPHVAAPHIKTVRRRCPRAHIIYDTVDLNFLREMRAAEVDGTTTLSDAELTKSRELRIASLADSTVVVSPYEAELLSEIAPSLDVHVVSNIHDTHPCQVPFDRRQDLLFIGGFEHPPNVDAMLWFTSDILPLIHKRLPKICLHIVGSKATDKILRLNSDMTPVHGYVPDVSPFFRECRLSVAPLRYGAGVKGKVNHSLAWGLPCVATTMAAEGMALLHGVDILIADDAEMFADAVVTLYTDEDLWNRLSEAGYRNIEKYFSFDAARRSLTKLCPGRNRTPASASSE